MSARQLNIVALLCDLLSVTCLIDVFSESYQWDSARNSVRFQYLIDSPVSRSPGPPWLHVSPGEGDDGQIVVVGVGLSQQAPQYGDISLAWGHNPLQPRAMF